MKFRTIGLFLLLGNGADVRRGGEHLSVTGDAPTTELAPESTGRQAEGFAEDSQLSALDARPRGNWRKSECILGKYIPERVTWRESRGCRERIELRLGPQSRNVGIDEISLNGILHYSGNQNVYLGWGERRISAGEAIDEDGHGDRRYQYKPGIADSDEHRQSTRTTSEERCAIRQHAYVEHTPKPGLPANVPHVSRGVT
ncbi:hypothetical protein ARMGADRAFT_1145033 [Armillaria gallica]|uniref:Uncharacterized protein n=1 Tax=Armillaria gallica TaxID=47427 RepID=A0A2H3E6D8_ARMGA|nr:hypothetical protein ARMGADRAFT_1145033 [Armillaria gallica]